MTRLPVPSLTSIPALSSLPFARRRTAPRIVLELDLSLGVAFSPPTSPLEALRLRQVPTVRALSAGLRRAATDDEVLGLIVHVGTCPLTLAQADEVGALVAEFSAAKPSIAHTETFGELTSGLAGYRVAINAGEIWLQPSGGVGLAGVHLQITLLRGGLEKLGLEPQFAQRHEFKSAADQLAATEVSPAHREMMQRIADTIVEDTVRRVEDYRRIPAEEVRAAMAQAPITAARALELGLVDHLGYRDEVYAHARAGWSEPWEPRYVHRYAPETPVRQTASLLSARREGTIAVVDVAGPIVTGPDQGRRAGAERICAALRAAGRDPAVRGVVLRVESPGGSYVASDAIRREVRALIEAERPVVAAMGTVAASGGYFVSMGADWILAQPTTLTGSIGVLAGKLVSERLLERVGVVHEGIDAGPRAGMWGGTRAFTDEEWRALDAWLDEVYADFTAKAAADRNLPLELLEPLARGRVWTGLDAIEHGLVDEVGGLRQAVTVVCRLAGVDADRVRLQTRSSLDVLRRLTPAESSESPQAAASGWPSPPATPAGPEASLLRLAETVGLPLPYGVLSLPWSISLG